MEPSGGDIDLNHIQLFAFKPATNNNIKPIAGLCPATLVVMGLVIAQPSKINKK